MLAAPLDAFAYGEGARVRGLPQTPSLATAPAGQDWIDTLLTQRFAMIDTVAPMPAASSDDPAAIARRLSALREFSAFAAVTIDGLIAAAPGGETHRDLEARGGAVLAKQRRSIAAALDALLDHPMVKSEGWFVISRFGEAADRDAVQLMREVPEGWRRTSPVLERLRALAPRGETTSDGVSLLEERRSGN